MSLRPSPVASVFRSIYKEDLCHPELKLHKLIASSKDSLDNVQRLGLQCSMRIHSGCVNTVCWNESGQYILSGSDDHLINITNPHTRKVVLKCKTGHRANIFNARFLPQSNDHSIVSCSGDGTVLHTELLAPSVRSAIRSFSSDGASSSTSVYERVDEETCSFNCHKSGVAYEVLTVPSEPRSFMSCGEDGTVRLFDLRKISSCRKICCKDNILILSPSAVTSMALSPITNFYVAVGGSDSIVRIYDRRYLSVIDFANNSVAPGQRITRPVKAYKIPSSNKRPYRVTSVAYSPEESDLLVSYSSDYLYLFDLNRDGMNVDELCSTTLNDGDSNGLPARNLVGEQIIRKFRLRRDWWDTGPDSRPESESGRVKILQVLSYMQDSTINSIPKMVSSMWNDTHTRIGLTGQNELGRENQMVLFESLAREYSEDAAIATAPSRSSGWRITASRSVNNERQSPMVVDNDVEITTANDTANDNASQDSQYDYLLTKFTGHRNARTMVRKAAFWGNNYVMCGSDCGHIFIWERRTGKLVMLLQGDQRVVNCLQPHPELPYLASSGLDNDVKIWAPILPRNGFDEDVAKDLMARNAIMLEQTKDTITVPPAFITHVIASMHLLGYPEDASGSGAAAGARGNVNRDANDDNNADDSTSGVHPA